MTGAENREVLDFSMKSISSRRRVGDCRPFPRGIEREQRLCDMGFRPEVMDILFVRRID
jgi:hypothetical protein